MDAETVVTFAPAKINLYLHILGTRNDGYHNLDSLVVFADVGDRVGAKLGRETTFKISGPHGSALEKCGDNLVLRAFNAFTAHVGYTAGVELELEKNLPVASGIGGGSTDASAVIKTLEKLFGIQLNEHDLLKLALDLGADVPACLLGRPVFMGGIGEILEPIENFPSLPAVLVNPDVWVSTAAVFKEVVKRDSKPGRINEIPHDIIGLVGVLDSRRNDLTEPAMKIAPEIGNVLSLLEAVPGCLSARMSGSGATCYGIFEDEASVQMAAKIVSDIKPHWWVMPTTLQGAGM